MSGDPDIPAEPFVLFDEWFALAKAREINDPNAMALATVDAHGLPNVRMVLMKEISPAGVVFYTNTESQKGNEIAGNPQAAVVFHWKSLQRQVRFRGPLTRVSDVEADAYFASRARDSRIGAWASQQSRPLEDRFALEKAVAREALRFGLGEVPRPPHWTGFRLSPLYIEFWQDKPFRLHERLVFRRDSTEAAFRTERLYP
jgi:pyridoxamine 5'-phosphate oxidase